MAVDESFVPDFIGISQRAARRGFSWDILGLSNLIVFPFFPQSISGLQLVLALPRNALSNLDSLSYRVTLTDESRPLNKGFLDQTFTGEIPPDKTPNFSVPALPPKGGTAGFGIALVSMEGSEPGQGSLELFPMPAPPLLLFGPTRVLVDVEMNGQIYRRGQIVCGFSPPAPLTDEERRALMSNPNASKGVSLNIVCGDCKAALSVYLNLDPNAPRSSKISAEAIPLQKAPDHWDCCGKNPVDLSFLKAGMHELFRRAPNSLVEKLSSPLSFTPLYEAGRVQDLIAQYEQLIDTALEEEPIQKYLEQHSLFWSFLAPKKILHKPAVLTKKKADFGILTNSRILYLVEIEKPTTKLTNQDGSISAEIQKGANQIRDWQGVVTDHRLALLSELGLAEANVQSIRYILIGGLARRTDANGLTKLRRTPFAPDTEFYCFDELGSFLHSIGRELNRL